ncbi:MAG: NAD(P)/FAD-dependent oxidoreductase [Lachnospirales bacterium]
MLDVIIIGAGIVGTAAALELSKFKLNTIVIDKRSDVSEGTSKANSGLVHSGHDCEPNTLKAKLNVRGNFLFTELCKDLEIPFRRNGAFVLCFQKEKHNEIEKLYNKAMENKVPDVSIIYHDEILKLEPNINDIVYSALYAKTAGIISPYEATIAFAENSRENGVEYKLNTKVTNIKKIENGYKVETNNGNFETKVVINSAGVYSDEINNMVSENKYKLKPRKGEYILFDRTAKHLLDKTIFQLPTELGKGILVSPTVHNNVFIGPSSIDIEDKDSLTTNSDVMNSVFESASKVVNGISRREIITSFAGLRANFEDGYGDFIVEEANDLKGFINALGINSPGLSAAPAIGEMLCQMAIDILKPEKNPNFKNKRKRITVFNDLSDEEKNNLIKENKSYGKIVCRCESVTEGEILDSIHRPLGATTIDGVKRRTRLGMGRCQGGFCTSKIIEILGKELNTDRENITKFGSKSFILSKD